MEPTTWLYAVGTLCAVITLGGGAFAFWNNLTAKITTNKLTAEAAKIEADKANNRIDALLNDLSAQREATAKNIGRLEATNDGLATAIKDMTASLRHVVDRLDQVVTGMAHLEARHG